MRNPLSYILQVSPSPWVSWLLKPEISGHLALGLSADLTLLRIESLFFKNTYQPFQWGMLKRYSVDGTTPQATQLLDPFCMSTKILCGRLPRNEIIQFTNKRQFSKLLTRGGGRGVTKIQRSSECHWHIMS